MERRCGILMEIGTDSGVLLSERGSEPMKNQVLEVIENRVSLRSYDSRPVTEEELDAILEAAMRAPTAGNQMLYSIIVIRDQKTKDLLAKSCDNQPFIASAPVLLLFAADQHKWFEYYKRNGVREFCQANGEKGYCFEAPQESDLILACEDTMAAAQNAVIAGESLGIGSCYIGDIVENYEYHQRLLGLPRYVFPLALLCMGHYREGHKRVRRERFDRKFVVFDEKYRELSDEEYRQMFAREETLYRPGNPYGADNYAQMFYARKTGAAFSKEMARSVRVALKDWDGRKL